MTDLKFCDWVEAWMTCATAWGQIPSEKDRMMCFCALTCLLADYSDDDVPIIHCYLTYLLLGVNTFLGSTKQHQFQDSREPLSHEIPVLDPIRELAIKLLTPGTEITTGDKHQFLVYLRKVCKVYERSAHTEHHGEELTILPLLAWAFGGWHKTMKRKALPNDPLTLRECINLAVRIDKLGPISAEIVYTSRSPVDINGWIVNVIDRLYRSCSSIDEILDQMVYVSWFVSFVLARAIMRTEGGNADWVSEVQEKYFRELETMRTRLSKLMDAGQEPVGTQSVVSAPILSKLLKASKWKPKLFQ